MKLLLYNYGYLQKEVSQKSATIAIVSASNHISILSATIEIISASYQAKRVAELFFKAN